MKHAETALQIEIVAWLRTHGYIVIHVPNGGWRSKREGRILKEMGVSAGFPDLLVLGGPTIPLGSAGMAIEVKAPGKGLGLGPAQEQWDAELNQLGWVTAVIDNFDDLKELMSYEHLH